MLRIGGTLALLALAGVGIPRMSVLPLVADVSAARGSALASQGRFLEAADAYRKALAENPEAEYYLLLGQVSTQAAERASPAEASAWLRRAEEALEAAARLDPLELDVALAQGRLHQVRASRLGEAAEWARAEASFRRAVELSPRRSYVRNRYGAVLAAQGRHAEALAQYRLSAALDPRYAATHGFMGDSLVAEGRLAEALEAYREASGLDPTLVLVRINLGELYLRLGRRREAAGEYLAAISLAPEDGALRARLAEIQR